MKQKLDIIYSRTNFHETYIVDGEVQFMNKGYLKFKTVDDGYVTIMLSNVVKYTQTPILENEDDLVSAMKKMGEN